MKSTIENLPDPMRVSGSKTAVSCKVGVERMFKLSQMKVCLLKYCARLVFHTDFISNPFLFSMHIEHSSPALFSQPCQNSTLKEMNCLSIRFLMLLEWLPVPYRVKFPIQATEIYPLAEAKGVQSTHFSIQRASFLSVHHKGDKRCSYLSSRSQSQRWKRANRETGI